MTTFFTSDLHIGHRLVSALRGFGHIEGRNISWVDTDAHNAQVAENWDRVVAPDDLVYVLGDAYVAARDEDLMLDWVSNRPGTKILIAGNHDRVHTAIDRPKDYEWRITKWRDDLGVFSEIWDEQVIQVAGHEVTLSHFPFRSYGDGPEVQNREPGFQPRYLNIRPWEGPKTILLHGHSHEELTKAHGRQFHVGLDSNNLELIPESEIADWITTLD